MNANRNDIRYHFRAPGERVSGPVRYAFGNAMDSVVLVARSGEGVCAILMGDDCDLALAELFAAFPGVDTLQDQDGLAEDLAKVVAIISGRRMEGTLDLDVGGTTFQQDVWRSLTAIPNGQTRSYQQVADAIGNPQSIRAVAGACAANLLAVAIPCHRVVRANGNLSGYRWGEGRKRTLLDHEAHP